MTTLVTAAQIAQVRRMVAEPTTTTYSDTLITEFIESYPMMDELGVEPYYWAQTSGSPTKTANTTWIPTYDLNAAAGDIWQEKAAAMAALYDFSADGGNYQRSQAYDNAQAMAKYYKSKKSLTTIHLVKSPKENATNAMGAEWIGNLPEPDTTGNDVSYLRY